MKYLLNGDNYTRTRNNPFTEQRVRQWIQYDDNTFEPVRREGSLNDKYHTDKRIGDWWVVDKPVDWDPAKEGLKVSLNHDFGQEDKPGPKGKPAVLQRKDMNKDGITLFTDRKTTMTRGSDGLKKLMSHPAGEAKPRSSAQDAEDLKQWEKEQGIDPNQGSGHERKPAKHISQAKQQAERTWVDFIKPPLWYPKGHPSREWAEGVLKNKLDGWGKTMKHGGHWSQGVIQELGEDGPEAMDIPRGLVKGLWFSED